MTAQIPDTVSYEQVKYVIAGVNGSGLFEPDDHGLRPTATSSANWRGYVCSYTVREDSLCLDRLVVSLGVEDKSPRPIPPALFGVEATSRADGHEAEYRFDHAPISFSGGLLLGKGFIDELYVHMGFHPAWKFREVLELIFKEGGLTRAHDHSERISVIRDDIASGKRPDPDGSEEDLQTWVSRTFELDYGRTFDLGGPPRAS